MKYECFTYLQSILIVYHSFYKMINTIIRQYLKEKLLLFLLMKTYLSIKRIKNGENKQSIMNEYTIGR